jgi:hypothetical protein
VAGAIVLVIAPAAIAFFSDHRFVKLSSLSRLMTLFTKGSCVSCLLGLQLAEATQTPLVEFSLFNRVPNCAARFIMMATVAESAGAGQFSDFVKDLPDTLFAFSQLKFSHSRGADQQSANGSACDASRASITSTFNPTINFDACWRYASGQPHRSVAFVRCYRPLFERSVTLPADAGHRVV